MLGVLAIEGNRLRNIGFIGAEAITIGWWVQTSSLRS